MSDRVCFKAGTLWTAIVERSRTALACGALHPIATDLYELEDHAVRFQVRVVSSLLRKKLESQGNGRRADINRNKNPFLPYEQELFVADISPTHLCLLNKYNVLDHHALIVTRAYEPQESPLGLNDFAALWTCMAEYDALAFYNSSPVAGASQPHRHFQLVPLPLAPSGPLPVSGLLRPPLAASGPLRLSSFPFANVLFRLDPMQVRSPRAAGYALDAYRSMLAYAGLADPEGPLPTPLPPYNLLVMPEFMWLIPRAAAAYDSVPVNALGFAGSFLVPDDNACRTIREVGPMALLSGVSRP